MRTHFIDKAFIGDPALTVCGLRWKEKRGKFVSIEYAITDNADACLKCLKFVKNRQYERNYANQAFEPEPDGLWEDCETCGGEGFNGHDCGEDTCCCRYPEENLRCQICDGTGGWYIGVDGKVIPQASAVGLNGHDSAPELKR